MLGRRLAVATASTLAVAGGLLMFDPNPPLAQALAVPPPPVTVTTAAAAAVAGTSGEAAVGTLAATGGAAVGTTGVVAGGVSASVVAGTAVAGLAIGTYAGQQVLRVLPDSWYSTTGSTLCDVRTLLDPQADCGGTGPQVGYVINSDTSVKPEGWADTNQLPIHWEYNGNVLADGVITYGEVTTNASLGEYVRGKTLDVPVSWSGSILGTNSVNASIRLHFGATGSGLAYVNLSTAQPTGVVHITIPDTSTYNTAPTYVEALSQTAGQNATALWYFPGDPLWTPAWDANPSRTLVASWSCSDGGGGTATSATFHETDAQWPAIPPAVCEAGIVTHYEVTKVGDGGLTTSVLTWDAPTEVQEFYAPGGSGAECWDGHCTLELLRLDPQTGQRLSCFNNPSLCVDWYSSPTKADDYVCTYGGNDVALAECNLYRPTFNRTMGQPTTDNNGEPVPASEAAPYGDPTADGNPVPEPSGSTEPAPEQDNSCPPPFTWTSLVNPWWYYKAGTCALEWAFVPSATTMQQWSNMTTDVAGRAPVSYMVGGSQWIGAAVEGASGEGSCANGPFEMADGEVVTGSFDLCETAVAVRQTTWGTVIYNIVTAAIVGGALFIAWKRIGGSLGGKG